jgi:hypothetical protein
MGNSDRHYTGSSRLACVRSAPQFLRNAILPRPSPDAITHSRVTYSIGHSSFTPDNLEESELIEDDQPYAGWLYLGFGLESEVIPKADRLRYLDTIELQLGVIGPLSGAEEVQRVTHDILGATDPQGWDNQLDNEPGINLFYSRQWTGAKDFVLTDGERFPKLSLDITPKLGAAVGNIHTFGAAGLTFRLGNFQPDDHGPPVIRPSLPGSDYFPRQDGWSAYAFGGVEGRVVGRNIFLDGSTFDKDSPNVDKNRLVGEARLGFVVTYGAVRLAYTHVFRSQEFEEQEPQVFGAAVLSVRF